MRAREEEQEKTERKLRETLHELGMKLEKLEKQIQETKFVSELLAQARQDIMERHDYRGNIFLVSFRLQILQSYV